MYIHELEDWPRFRWNAERTAGPLASVRHRQGRLIGHMEALGFDLQREAVLKTLTGDVLTNLTCIAFFGGLILAVFVGAMAGNFLRRAFWKLLIQHRN